jgi:hypothetical protein
MIGQSFYYLTNKKYISNITNFDNVITELNAYYTTGNPRTVVLVHPSPKDGEEVQLMPAPYEQKADSYRLGLSGDLVFRNFSDVVNSDYIQNSDKEFLLFSDEEDMLHAYARYVAGLLSASGFYNDSETSVADIACDFIESIIQADFTLTLMYSSEIMNTARSVCASILADPETPAFDIVYQNGKNFSYDLLFYLNDNYPCDGVKNLIIEKFTVHSNEIARDVMEQFTSQRRDMAYILSVIDWKNANGTPMDKTEFVQAVFVDLANAGNYTAAFYKLEELWNSVKDNEDFIAAHTSKVNTIGGWEYNDQYNEINHLFPTVRKVLERSWDINNISDELKLMDTDVQFFAKRQNRIPYLIHKYTL